MKIKKRYIFELLFLAISICSLVVYVLSDFDQISYHQFVFLFLYPPSVVVFIILFFVLKQGGFKNVFAKIFFSICPAALIAFFVLGPIALVINRYVPETEQLMIEGPVEKKDTEPFIEMRDTALERKFIFEIDKDEYEKIKIGDNYKKTIRRGTLGIYYY